jgi:hypothetical protein
MIMSKYDYELIRHAARPWICDRCGETIAKGERYIDRGWRNDFKEWIHIRKHICCCPSPEEYPIPVSLKDGTKEWLLGVVHQMDGTLALLTRDWEEGGKYHFRDYVYNERGRKIFSKSLKNN